MISSKFFRTTPELINLTENQNSSHRFDLQKTLKYFNNQSSLANLEFSKTPKTNYQNKNVLNDAFAFRKNLITKFDLLFFH